MDRKEKLEGQLYTEEFIPRFRDAEADGLLGVRGYFNLFQDLTSAHMYHYGIGNDKLPERTGCAWIFTKYKLHVYRKADFDTPLRMETWIEPVRSPLLVNHGLCISAGGEIYAAGRVESCPINLKEQKLVRLSAIGFKDDISLERDDGLGRFTRSGMLLKDPAFCYEHTVRYADLDKSRHMNNIKYIDMFLNAFSAEYFRENHVTEMEVQFRSQCFEGERLKVSSKEEDNAGQDEGLTTIRLQAVKEDGTLASTSIITTAKSLGA